MTVYRVFLELRAPNGELRLLKQEWPGESPQEAAASCFNYTTFQDGYVIVRADVFEPVEPLGTFYPKPTPRYIASDAPY